MNHKRVAMAALVVFAALAGAATQGTTDGNAQTAPRPPDLNAYSSGAPYDQVRRGWHFFDDPEPEVPQESAGGAKTQIPQPPQQGSDRADLRRFDAMQKQLEDYRKIAVLNPTDQNVRRYMEMENRVYRMAGRFSDVSQRVAWSTPELDMSLQGRPINARAIDVFDRVLVKQRHDSIVALSKTHVLFFFFRSDCPYCHAFSPTLRAFEGKSGIKVVPVSLDGGGLPVYPEPRRDNGIATTLQVTQVPALYLAEPSSGKITPIGFGILSESQLLERIATVSAPDAEGTLPSATKRIRLQ